VEFNEFVDILTDQADQTQLNSYFYFDANSASLSIYASSMAAEKWWDYLKGSPDGRRLLNEDESAIELMTVARVAGSTIVGYETAL
jgi:hypothetical protein